MNEKQVKFCDEYLLTFNASEAVRRAGYKTKKPAAYGYRLLKQKDIGEYLINNIYSKATIAGVEIINELKSLLKGILNENDYNEILELYKKLIYLNKIVKGGLR